MLPKRADATYLGTHDWENDRCFEESHLPCHQFGWIVPNAFTDITTHHLQAAPSDALYCCHTHAVPNWSPDMTSKNAANLETPQKQATSTSAAMRIPTCESHCLPTYRGANSTSLSPLQPTENNHYVSSGVDLGSPLTTFSQNVENAQNKHIYDFTIAQNSPYPSRHERFDNIFILPDDPFTLTPPDISRDLRTFSSPAFVAETAANGALHMHAASESAFEVNDPLTQADRFDTTLQDFDSTMFGMPDLVAPNVDYQPISLDNWTTPNTLVEAITPKLPAQSSWPIVRYDDLIGVPNSTIDALEELQLDFDFNFQDFEPDFISSGHVNPDLELPSYPPVPDTSPQLDGGGLDQPEMPSPYHVLPPVPCMNEEVPAAWMGLDMSQSLCPADVVNTIHTIPTPEMSSGTRSRPPGAKSAQRDTSKDDFLVRCKERGMSYKQIKILGHFEEAESTLRGRYRALTKPREARLRKPEWGNQEIRLLFDGVATCSKSAALVLRPGSGLDAVSIGQFVNKVPWKQVAEYMESQGSYRYGNATVKKKYLEVLKARGAPV